MDVKTLVRCSQMYPHYAEGCDGCLNYYISQRVAHAYTIAFSTIHQGFPVGADFETAFGGQNGDFFATMDKQCGL
jgi:hypothetical protein